MSAFPIDKKLVVAVASSALFDLSESNQVWEDEGPTAYERYQDQHIDDVLKMGVAFPFIRRFLGLNDTFEQEQPVEVVLLSRNSPSTGRRVFRSIEHYGLNITRGTFMDGKSPYAYIPAFNASLFLSANAEDVVSAIEAGFPAGTVLPTTVVDDLGDRELRIAFDFDGVIADDSAERVYKRGGLGGSDLPGFIAHETEHSEEPLDPGPLQGLFKRIADLQQLERRAQEVDRDYDRIIRVSIITARSAPAHERMITTLRYWGVEPDETFLLGGMEKGRILDIMKPHIFFDDQRDHLKSEAGDIPMAHIPFGVANQKSPSGDDSSAVDDDEGEAA